MYAIFETAGKQYKVSTGDIIRIQKIKSETSVTFTNVLMVADGDTITYGAPYLKSAKIAAEVVDSGKSKKILVFKKKTRKTHRKLRGHRQHYTAVKINEITVS